MTATSQASHEAYRGIMHALEIHAMQNQRCPAAAVGAAIVVNGYAIVVGVNGAPQGVVGCVDDGCEWISAGTAGTGRDHARHLHAETAAICTAAMHGRRVLGADIVVTKAPCPSCALLIIATGLARCIVRAHTIPNGWDAILRTLHQGGVQVVILE